MYTPAWHTSRTEIFFSSSFLEVNDLVGLYACPVSDGKRLEEKLLAKTMSMYYTDYCLSCRGVSQSILLIGETRSVWKHSFWTSGEMTLAIANSRSVAVLVPRDAITKYHRQVA